MKLSEFKQTIKSFNDSSLRPNLRHFNVDIFIEVEYFTNAGVKDTAYVDEVYIDKIKNRIFYLGKSEELKRGWFSRKGPMKINLMKFLKWADSSKYANFDVYFAWEYDFKDQNLFDYIPLSNEVKAEPLDQNIKKLIFVAEKGKPFKIKVRNLHEKLQKFS